jgi:hypothetical protein
MKYARIFRTRVGHMYFPQFLVGMVATLCVVATWVYSSAGSVWFAVCWTVAAALLLQAGYFGLVLGLVNGKHGDDKAAGAGTQEPIADLPR